MRITASVDEYGSAAEVLTMVVVIVCVMPTSLTYWMFMALMTDSIRFPTAFEDP